MSDPTPSLPLETLLEHSAWVRALARRLARDPAAADDLAQDAWVAALEHPPRPGRPARGWLGAVVRNLARQSRRGEGRRKTREQAAARPEATPSTAELVERAALQRKVVDAVLSLEEPYRTAILLRFFEELPPREIARRLGAPVETVKTRISRGLERLRARLDRDFGERRTWLALLVPLARPPLALSTVTTGVLLVNAKIAAAALLLLAAAGAWFALAPREREVAEAAAAPAAPAVAPLPVPLAAGPAGGEAPERAEVRLPDPAPAPDAPAPADPGAADALPAGELRGLVLLQDGRPAAGVEVALELDLAEAAPGVRARSGPDGRFSMETPPGSGRLVVAGEGLESVLASLYGSGPAGIEAVLVVAPRIVLAGSVADDAGLPLEGARIDVRLPEDFRARFGEVLDRSADLAWTAASDAQGLFRLPRAPAVEGGRLVASLDGYEDAVLPLPLASDELLHISLARPGGAAGMVRGRVVDAAGAPLEGARVAFGLESAVTPRGGEFAFEIEDADSLNKRFSVVPDALTALRRGSLPARFEPPRGESGPLWPAWIELRLGGPSFEIGGRVIGADGEPLEGAKVWVDDTTLFGSVEDRPVSVEGLLAGRDDTPWAFVTSGEDGRFRIEGLLDRGYTLSAMDPRTLLRASIGPVASGRSGVEIRMPAGALYERVAGRVVSHRGEPIGGVQVLPMCDAYRMRFRGQVIGTSHDVLAPVVTDGEGRFTLEDVPKSLVYLRVQGDAILPLEFGRSEGDARLVDEAAKDRLRDAIEDLEIEVDQRCHLQVELVDPAAADELSVLDASGEPVTLNLYKGNSRRELRRVPILDGRTPVLALPDTGILLVLFKDGAEVHRRGIELAPGEVSRVQI